MGSFIQKEIIFSKKWFKSYTFIILGTFIMAVGYTFFITPNKIVPGGIYGIAIVLHYTLGFPVGLTALAFNIPLTLLSIKVLGPRFGSKTITGFILTAVFIDGLTYFWGEQPLVQDDVLLSAIFGGLLIGVGVGLLFKAKASCGGTDLIAMMIGKISKIPLGQLMIIVDSSIVILGLIVFEDWKIPLYSWIVIFVMGKVIDVVLQGISYEKTIFIVSEKSELLRDKIIHDLKRGGTFIQGKGMYQGTEKQIIYTTVNRRELSILMEYINKLDPDAFMSVIDANEVIGKGFKSIADKVE